MRRFLLLAVFVVGSVGLLVWLSGGLRGRGARDGTPEIEVETPVTERPPTGEFAPVGDFPARLHALEDTSIPAPPEPVRYVDAATGESVLIPDFLRWYLTFRKGLPAASQRPGRQALEIEGVRIVTWRKPQTLEEAHALARTADGIRDRTRKWEVTAPHALVDGLAVTSLDARPGGEETEVEVDGGVKLIDVTRDMVITTEALTLWPHQDRAESTTRVLVRHEAFEMVGDGLVLKRDGRVTRIEIPRNAILRMYGDVPGPDGKPLLDLGDDEFVPGFVMAEGGAVLVHRAPEQPGSDERMTIELTRRVHAEQGKDRSLDAERLRVEAYRLQTPEVPGDKEGWRLERFEADGGVIILYSGVSKDDSPYGLSASSRYLQHDIAPDGSATTLLEGSPEFTLRGRVPLDGLQGESGPSFMRATATEQALLEPAPSTDVPHGADPRLYRRLILRGDARLESRDAGLDPTRDNLEGEQMTVLLKEVEERTIDDQTRRRIVAVSFDMLGDVRLGGTRMSGMTHHLRAVDLDTASPVLTADGPGTSFAFHGLRHDEHLLGGSTGGADDSSRDLPPEPASPGSAAEKGTWTVERLLAREEVVVETSVGGPALGLPARLEGKELTYDRISDRARVIAEDGADVYLTVGAAGPERHELRAQSMQLDRGRGEVEASGRVRASVYVRTDGRTASNLALPEAATSEARTLGVATNGRIEIRTRVTMDPWAPRPGAEQILTIEGERVAGRIQGALVAELTSSTLEADTLRARYLQLSLVHSLPAPTAGGAPTPPTARVGLGRSTPSSREAPRQRKREPLQRWDLEAERLRARFGAAGFEHLEASGRAQLTSEEGEVHGDTFTYEALLRRLRVAGTPRQQAWASFGPDEERNEVRARTLELRLAEGGPEHLHATRPVLATLIRRDPDVPGAIERFLVAPTGDVEMTRTTLTTEGLVEIRRRVRPGAGQPWEAPFRLWANRLVVRGRNLLADEAPNVDTVIATGPDTTLRAGDGDDMTTVWGERFELDVATSEATLEGGSRGALRILRGRVEDPRADSEQSRIVIDLDTNTIHDWQHPRVILRGGRDFR